MPQSYFQKTQNLLELYSVLGSRSFYYILQDNLIGYIFEIHKQPYQI